MAFQFSMFGLPRLEIDHQPVALSPQPAAFCSFLVLNRQRRITREEVQAAFWPDAEPERAQERLRRTLYLLRRAIEPHTDLIAAEGVELAVAPDASLWVDYEAFEAALLDAYRTDQPNREPLESAVALYRDDLLKDIYADWALLEREHARQRFLTALRHLIGVCQGTGDWQAVIRHAQRLLEHDPYQEAAHRALMTAYAAGGDRSAALRQYQTCAQILDEELGAEPLPETVRLYEDIRQGRGVKPAAAPAVVAPQAAPATALHWVPLVGRDTDLAEIAAEWRQCRARNSRLVLVTGPAGMGKTRLVEEAAARVPGPGVVVVTGNCYAMEAGTPYQLIADLVRDAAGRAVHKLPAPARADLAYLVPGLAPGAAVDMPGGPGSAPDVSLRLHEAFTQVVRALAAGAGGLWLVAEDLHWADPASLACLNYALRRCADLPVMMLATLRDEEVLFDSPLMDWPASSVHAPAPTTVIRLVPLAPDHIDRLVSQLVEADVTRLVPLLHHETAGNPFFVVETLRAMIEQGVLHLEREGRWQLRADALSEASDLPMSDAMLRVIRGRVRRLSRAGQELLTAAAVVEHDIDEALLSALVDPALALDLALDEVLRASILAEAAPGVYQFTHIKVREIVYADTSAPRRRFLHRRTAELLRGRGQPDRLPDIAKLAYHYAQAREWTQALIHGWRAATTALAAGALAEANRYATTAQDMLDRHAVDLDRDALPVPLAAIRFDLVSLRAEFRRRATTAGLYYPPELMDEVAALVPDLDVPRQARAALHQAMHRLGQGDLTGARSGAQQGRALFAQAGDRWGELDALQHQCEIAYRAGDMAAIRRLLDEMQPFAPEIDPAIIRPWLGLNEMRLAVYQGRWEAVLALAQELASARKARFDPAVEWLSLANVGLAYMKLGAHEEAYAIAQQAVEASDAANVLGLGAKVLLARLALCQGRPAEGRSILLGVLETPDPLIGEVEVVTPALALVRCLVALGEVDSAEKWARRAALAMGRVRLPILFPLSQVAWALVHLARGKFEDARQRLSYPLEYLLLLDDTSPQEICALRAAAARGLGDESGAAGWLDQAWDLMQQQASAIENGAYRDRFLTQVPLHCFIERGRGAPGWDPAEVLDQQIDRACT